MMDWQKKHRTEETKLIKKKNYFYLFSNICLVFILPLLSIAGEFIFENSPVNWNLIGKWFIFWTIGIRLFITGISQASDPEFTADRIFKIKNSEGYIVVRELGFANIALGTMGILSAINDHWRLITAITGGLFLALGALQYSLKKIDGYYEVIIMMCDSFVFFILILYLIFTLFL